MAETERADLGATIKDLAPKIKNLEDSISSEGLEEIKKKLGEEEEEEED